MRRDRHQLIDPRAARAHIRDQVVGQLQEMLLVVPDAGEISKLIGSNGAMEAFGHYIDVAKNGVERGAQLVADATEKTGFVASCELGLVAERERFVVTARAFERFGAPSRQILGEADFLR